MSTSTIEVKTSSRFFYGWLIVVVATLAMLVTNGLTIGGLPVFFAPMLESLRLPREVTAFGSSLTLWASGLFSLPVGWLVRRFSVRMLMTIGCVLLGSGLLIYARATERFHIYAAHILFGLSLCFAGLLMNSVLISNWFRRQRGLAMGIVITGTSLGAALVPFIAKHLFKIYDWRTTMLFLSVAVWVVLLPAILLVVRDTPESRGLLPDGDVNEQSNSSQSLSSKSGLLLGEAIRTQTFWIFALCAVALFYAILTVLQQFILYLREIGVSADHAADAQSALALASVGGKFLFGWLSDKLPKARAFLGCCTLMFLSTLVLLMLTPNLVLLFLIPFGLAYGGSFVVIQVLAVERFGLRDVGRILGIVAVIETCGGATGLLLTGIIARQFGGSYAVAFKGVIVAGAVSVLAGLLLNRHRNQRVVSTV